MGNHDHPSDSLGANELKAMHFLVCALYLTDEKIKGSFSRYLDARAFDGAIETLRENKELPEWFSKMFSYDPLYGTLTPLRELLSLALTCGLIRLDGTYYKYHLDQVTGRIFPRLLQEQKLELTDVQKFADRMSQIILNPTK